MSAETIEHEARFKAWAAENAIPAANTQPEEETARGEAHSNGTGHHGASQALPPIVDGIEAANLYGQTIPPEIIKGILHQSGKMVIGGGSKSFKTWTLIDLALSVATGAEWWGIQTAGGRVLYINLELQKFAFGQRQNVVGQTKGITLQPGQLDVWHLRGFCADLTKLAIQIIERARDKGYVLIVVDPIYKCIGDRDENAAGAIADLLNQIERLAVQTGAAVVFGAHFSKGNQANKESMDRISGSGVFARDPDSILTLTRHEEADSFTVDCTLRNFPQIEPFAVRWQYPLMVRDGSLDPAKLKKPRTGRESKYSVQTILDVLEQDTMKAAEFQKAVSEETGMSRAKFYDLLSEAKAQGKIKQTSTGAWFKK